jgi:hypothetical protein
MITSVEVLQAYSPEDAERLLLIVHMENCAWLRHYRDPCTCRAAQAREALAERLLWLLQYQNRLLIQMQEHVEDARRMTFLEWAVPARVLHQLSEDLRGTWKGSVRDWVDRAEAECEAHGPPTQIDRRTETVGDSAVDSSSSEG